MNEPQDALKLTIYVFERLSSPPAWKHMHTQNPVTPSNTPVIQGVFARNPGNGSGKQQTANTNASTEEVTEKPKHLGQ